MTTTTTLFHHARKMDIAHWHAALVARLSDPSITLGAHPLPGAPNLELQIKHNGREVANSMPAARDFLAWFDPIIQASPLYDDSAVYLDYGAGWGRIWRYFLYTFPIERTRAFDVNPNLEEVWQNINLNGDIRIGQAGEALPFEDGEISFATSNSVWSHLSENLALSTLAQVRRVMKPGGLFALTSFGMPHLQRWKRFKDLEEPTERQNLLANLADDFDTVIQQYADGKFIYLETGLKREGNYLIEYEIAAAPRQWFETKVPNWELVEFSDKVLPQSLILLKAV